MADKAHKATDKMIKDTEKDLRAIYERERNEIEQKWNAYLHEINDRYKKLKIKEEYYRLQAERAKTEKDRKAALVRMEAAQADIEALLSTALLTDTRYQDMVEETAIRLTEVNSIAVTYINKQIPTAYALNFNYTGLDISSQISGYSFTLVDERTVKELVTKSDKLILPYKKIDETKDKRWNVKRINAELLQGILQGENPDMIASRLLKVEEMNYESAMRAARTMYTSAQNRGREDAMKAAQEDGVEIVKEWIATIDERTRRSHKALHGVKVKLNDTFPNGLRYPGDEMGAPAEVYNCRCTMREVIIGFHPTHKRQIEKKG